MTALRLLLGVVAIENLELEQLHVKMTFLHGDLKEDINMSQPTGFTVMGDKSLYGLKQASQMSYKKLDTYIRQRSYRRSDCDPCMYSPKLADDCREKSSRNETAKAVPSREICDEGTRTRPIHTRDEDLAKSEDKDSPALRHRLHPEVVEVFKYGERKANTNTASDIALTIRQRLSIHRSGEKDHEKNTLRIGRRKSHVPNGGDKTRPCICHRGCQPV